MRRAKELIAISRLPKNHPGGSLCDLDGRFLSLKHRERPLQDETTPHNVINLIAEKSDLFAQNEASNVSKRRGAVEG